MPLQATSGAASYDAFGGGVPVVPAYIEEVFSTYLYTGNGTTQTITNGIDLSSKGGMVWIKNRGVVDSHQITDTVSAQFGTVVSSNLTDGAAFAGSINTPLTSGFYIESAASGSYNINESAEAYASWTFRKQPKFFDIQIWTGSGANRTISHNLGSVPACIMVKRLDDIGAWQIYHRSLANTEYLVLNTTAAKATDTTRWNSTTPTSTVFSIGTDATVNASSGQYVAFIFAHDSGGFGLTGTDNVISCGSVTANGSGAATINLGYEPQWFLLKNITSADSWYIFDNMRGLYAPTTLSPTLRAQITNAEVNSGASPRPSATGVSWTAGDTVLTASNTYIYIAIRRGPMKVPTSGTSVFGINARSGTGANATVTGGQTDDAIYTKIRTSVGDSLFASRLTGTGYSVTSSAAAEVAAGATILQANPWDVMDGVKVGTTSALTNVSGDDFINYLFKRAPSVFDVVCYTGTGGATTINHNLAVVPEMMIVKPRSTSAGWRVYVAPLGNTSIVELNTTSAAITGRSDFWDSTSPTSTVFTVGSTQNGSTITYIAYLFGTCAGISKVFSYTGNGSSQTINCGFTGGARFVLIKRTDSTGDWYVWDTTRGIVAGNDPYLRLNSTASEVTSNDTIDTDSTGFVVNQVTASNVNVTSASYIGLAIA